MSITLYCYSGNEQVFSIDPNSLAIITLLHWYEVGFEIVQCCSKNESPSKDLPSMLISDKYYSGYRNIVRGLKDSGLVALENDANLFTLSNREFLLQLNQDLLVEEFSNEAIFKHFTEPALLKAKSNYWWNFMKSRIFPLNYQIQEVDSANLSRISNQAQIINELEKITKDSSIENRIILFSHLVIRSLLPKHYKFSGFDDFINKISADLDRKEFKGIVSTKISAKPKYKHEPIEEYETNISSSNNMNVYTGLFGVVLAVGILYSIKNR